MCESDIPMEQWWNNCNANWAYPGYLQLDSNRCWRMHGFKIHFDCYFADTCAKLHAVGQHLDLDADMDDLPMATRRKCNFRSDQQQLYCRAIRKLFLVSHRQQWLYRVV